MIKKVYLNTNIHLLTPKIRSFKNLIFVVKLSKHKEAALNKQSIFKLIYKVHKSKKI